MNIPENLKYTEDHEWVRIDDESSDDQMIVVVGITDFAQGELGDIVYVEVDTVEETLDQGEVFGTVEAVKTTSDLFMPVSGKILEFNPELNEEEEDNPALINEDPYHEAWLIKIEVSDASEMEKLLSPEEYKELIS